MAASTLLELTIREAVSRPLRDVGRSTILAYEAVMIGLAPALVAVLGVLRLLARRRRWQQPYVPSSGSAA